MTKHSHLITAILTPAIKFWIRTQVERIADLELTIAGDDRQILSGYIPQVHLAGRNIIYRGLYLSQMQVQAEEIHVNLGQVVRGKPLRLLSPIPILAALELEETDLNASLKSDLLAGAIAEFLVKLLALSPSTDEASGQFSLQRSQMQIGAGWLKLAGNLTIATQPEQAVLIRTGLNLQQGRQLCFQDIQSLPDFQADQGNPRPDLEGFILDLGEEVNLQELDLTPGRLTCKGKIQVNP